MGLLNTMSSLIKKSFSGQPVSLSSRDVLSLLGFGSTYYKGLVAMKKLVEEGYAKNPNVYMAVSRTAEKTASLPRTITGAGKSLIESPNKWQTQIEFDEVLATELIVTGNAFLFYTRGIGAGEEWRVGQSYNIEIVADSDGNVTAYKETLMGKAKVWEPEMVLHIKFPNIVDDSSIRGVAHLYGTPPLCSAWDSIIASNELLTAEANVLVNKGALGIVTTETDAFLDPDEQKRLQDEFDSRSGGASKFNKTLFTNASLKYMPMGMSPTDLKLLESQVSKLRTICGVLNLSSTPFNDPDNNTYANAREFALANMIDAYLPIGNKIDSAKERYLTKLKGPTTIEIDKDEIEVFQREDIEQEPDNNIDNQ